jgi:DNA-binding GntR family transcriptional regulator
MIRKYQSLKDHVHDFIATRIQSGVLLPNQKINEAAICKSLEVSRTPVREALIQLSSENLLEYIPRRGFIVKEINTDKKLDVFQVVGALDALAASLAMNYLTEEDFAKMEELIERIDTSIKENNYHDYQHYQTEFHKVYIDKCRNSTLIETLESLQNSFIRQTYLSDDTEKLFQVLERMNEEHRKILGFFKEKDKNGLVEIIQHVHWNIDHIEMI